MSRNLTTLKHFDMFIPQEFLLTNEYGYGDSSYGDYEDSSPAVELSSQKLKAFLESCPMLSSFVVGFGDCCEKHVREMTKDGTTLKALARHNTLSVFRATNAIFTNADDLTSLLDTWKHSLKVLDLVCLTLGRPDHKLWSTHDVNKMITSISNLKSLVKLQIMDYCPIRDNDLERLLSGRSNLRSLEISGTFGDMLDESGLLTDSGLETIARCCPNLQSLTLNYHSRLTTRGVACVMRGCPHLRELNVCKAQLRPQDLKELFALSSKLLMFSWRSPMRAGQSGAEMRMIRDAISSTGGRTLLIDDMMGIVEPEGLSSQCKAEIKRSKVLVEEASDITRTEGNNFNEWEHLF